VVVRVVADLLDPSGNDLRADDCVVVLRQTLRS
jgi:hypothetical protein